MSCHVLDNLALPDSRFILLARPEHCQAEPETVAWIKERHHARFVMVDKLTEGAACTVLYARALIDDDSPLLIANSDQIVDMDVGEYLADCGRRGLDGSVLCFEDDDPKWSFAQIDASGLITRIREKEVISTHATVGIYYFAKGRDFVASAIDMIARNERVNNEFYVAPAYNHAIANGGRFGIFPLIKARCTAPAPRRIWIHIPPSDRVAQHENRPAERYDPGLVCGRF